MIRINPFRRRLGMRLAVMLVILAFAATFALADGLEDARRRGRLLVDVKTDFPPVGHMDSAGQYHGLDVEIARYLGRILFGDEGQDQPRVEFVAVTSGSRIPFLFSGWIDVIIATMTVTTNRQKVLEFSDPYFTSGSLLPVRSDSPIQGLADLVGQSVAVIEGAVQQHDLAQVAPRPYKSPLNRSQKHCRPLKRGRWTPFARMIPWC